MDTNEAEVVLTHKEHVDIRMSNNLDLNIEHDCNRSPTSPNVSGVPSRSSSKLKIGTEFESDEHAYMFYHKYAELAGFGVRKDWVNRSKIHGRVMSRKFTCFRQGHRKKDKRDVLVKRHRKETRTGCLAQMVITRQPNGKYLVTHFEAEHNHEDVNLTKAEELLILPSFEKPDSAETSETGSMKNTEIHSKLPFQLLGLQVCPPENFNDFQMNDNIFLKSGRTRDMNEGDASRLVCYFNRQHFVNPLFFYSLHLDIDDKVSNIFWADDNMISEYGHFGDVVCLDTSCVRNTNSRPFVQFVGLNNHRQVVIFGAALLYDDSVDSLKWLFRTFIEAMSGKKPKFILSDHDATVVQAIHEVLPETNHSICAWQMYLIALKHLRRAMKEYDSFVIDFRSCIFAHEHEDDFVQSWDFMLEKYGLCNNAWLKWMFREKEKWAVSYGRNTFFVERDGTHLVELLADKLKNYLSPDIDVLHFFKHFESVVNEQRYSELESTFKMGKCAPVLMANAILLKHPSETYTPSAFEVFQREYEKCLNVVINKCGERDSKIDFKAKTLEKSREFSVVFNSLDGTVSCNCMKFEHVGFLCSHALKVFDHQNIKILPLYYILNRWTRDARVLPAVENSVYAGKDNRNIVATRYKDLCRDIIKISARAAVSDPAFEFASRQLNEVMQGIEKILSFKSSDESKGDCGADSRLDGADINGNEYLCRDVEDVLKESGETESMVPDKDQLNCCDVQFPSSSCGPSVRLSLPETVLAVACAPSTYISSPSPTPSLSPLTQRLYTIEANQMVQSMYQASNLTINQQSNPNLYDSNIYSNQHHSPSHNQFIQESLIRNQFQDPRSNGTTQVIDDTQHPHASSFMHYNHRYRAAGV